MKRSLLLITFSLSIPVYSFAQRGGGMRAGRNDNVQPVQVIEEMSTLSVFSENAEPFFLVLNGVKQNVVPQSKIRVEALPQFVTDVQIIFANSRIAPLRKKIVISDPLNGGAVSLALKVSIGRGGNARLEFHRMMGCENNYHGPRDEYVMYYGKPQQINTVTEATFTDPTTGNFVTQTTTTTTSGYSNLAASPNRPMSEAAFSDARQSISSASFDDTKLSTAKTILNTNYVSTDQVIQICKLFSFEDTRLAFAKYAYSRTVDIRNYFKVANVLSFDANKNELNNFISANPK